MKKLKDEQSSPQEAKPKEGRGFVGECLVRVECVGGASVERLQVRGRVWGCEAELYVLYTCSEWSDLNVSFSSQEVCSVFGEVAYVDLQDGDKEVIFILIAFIAC